MFVTKRFKTFDGVEYVGNVVSYDKQQSGTDRV